MHYFQNCLRMVSPRGSISERKPNQMLGCSAHPKGKQKKNLDLLQILSIFKSFLEQGYVIKMHTVITTQIMGSEIEKNQEQKVKRAEQSRAERLELTPNGGKQNGLQGLHQSNRYFD